MANLKTPHSVGALQGIVLEYNVLIDNFSIAQIEKAAALNKIQKVSNDFLERTRVNCEALIPLLEIYKTNSSMIQPIGLLIRSILSDFLTFCYLVTYAAAGDDEQEGVQNELHLLEKDFLRSMLEVGELESRLNEYNTNIPNAYASDVEYQAHLAHIKQEFGHLYINDGQLRIKRPAELRATTDQYYCDSPGEFANPGNFMTEKYKWERMIRKGFGKYVTIFAGFKFFSQFQHYSKMSMEMIREDSAGTLFFHLVLAINALLIMSDFQIQLIDGNNGPHLAELRTLEVKFDDVVGDE